MKKIIQLVIVAFIINACTQVKDKEHLTFSGKIENKTCDSIVLKSFYKMKQAVIKLSPDGSFKDTLTVIKGYYGLYIGDVFKKVYFKNGDNINMIVDLNNFGETLNFTGKGVEEIKLMQKYNEGLRFLYEGEGDLFELSETDFNAKNNAHASRFNELLKDKALDSAFVVSHKIRMKSRLENANKSFKESLYIKNELGKGKPSPKFVDFINHKGGTTSLDDFKGKYVYLDFWATYCRPCIVEFPALDELREKHKNKNIEFINISIDFKGDLDKWKNYVTENKLKGTQLLIDNGKSFEDAYRLTSIPRYILIDPAGNIVDAKTFKPSDPKLTELLDSLDL